MQEPFNELQMTFNFSDYDYPVNRVRFEFKGEPVEQHLCKHELTALICKNLLHFMENLIDDPDSLSVSDVTPENYNTED